MPEARLKKCRDAYAGAEAPASAEAKPQPEWRPAHVNAAERRLRVEKRAFTTDRDLGDEK